MKKYLLRNINTNVIVMATNDYDKAKDYFMWGENPAEILCFNEQGEHYKTISDIRRI